MERLCRFWDGLDELVLIAFSWLAREAVLRCRSIGGSDWSFSDTV